MRTTVDLRHIFPVISGTLTGGDGATYALDGHSIPAGSLTFKSGTSPAGTFAIGGAIIGSVSFALLDASGTFSSVVWKDSRVTFSLTCGQTTVNMGEFFTVSHSESGGVISVTAFDALKILDSYEMHELAITYPTTVGALASAIASAHGLTVSGIRTPNLSIDDPGNDRMTQRACISYLAQLCGQFVTVKGSVLSFGWYDLSNPTDDGATFAHDWGTSDTTITGIRVSDNDNTTAQDRGADGYRIEISGNPFITSTNASGVADVIWAACSGISFRAGSAEILASPAFEAGDCVTVRTLDEQGVKLLLTNITYSPDVSMSITSDADAQEGDLALNKSPYIKKGEEAKQATDMAISDQLADPDSELSKAISGASGGTALGITVSGTWFMHSGSTSAPRSGLRLSSSGVASFSYPLTSDIRASCGGPYEAGAGCATVVPAYKVYEGNIRREFPLVLGLWVKDETGSDVHVGFGYVTLTAKYVADREDVIEIKTGTRSNTDVWPMVRIDKMTSSNVIDFVPFACGNLKYIVRQGDGNYWAVRGSYPAEPY